MRHTFLPAEEQKILKRGYRLHAAIVALFLVSVAGLVGIGSLFPAYIHVLTEERAKLAVVDTIRKDKDSSGIAQVESALRSDAALIAALADVAPDARPSKIIERLVSARGQVRLLSVSLDEVGSTTASLTLQGSAPTRESLVSFKTRLENMAKGAKADLPISELAKSRDIAFSMKVILPLP